MENVNGTGVRYIWTQLVCHVKQLLSFGSCFHTHTIPFFLTDTLPSLSSCFFLVKALLYFCMFSWGMTYSTEMCFTVLLCSFLFMKLAIVSVFWAFSTDLTSFPKHPVVTPPSLPLFSSRVSLLSCALAQLPCFHLGGSLQTRAGNWQALAFTVWLVACFWQSRHAHELQLQFAEM